MQPFFDNLGSAFDGMFQGALPDDSDTPLKLRKHLHVACVPVDISLKLLFPEIAVGLRCRCVPASLMSVPKAAVNEYHSPVFWEHKVGYPGKGLHMKSIPEALCKKAGTEGAFGPRILCPDTRHHAAALRSRWNSHGHESCQAMVYESKRLCELWKMHKARCGAQEPMMAPTRTEVQGGG